MEKRQKRELIFIAILIVTPILIVAAEFQFNWFEHMIGSYLESNNDQRERLAKFVEQDARTQEADKTLQNLLTQKATTSEDEEEGSSKPGIFSGVVRLDKNKRLIMTTAKFKAVHQKLSQAGKSIPQAKLAPRMSWSKSWKRTIVVRPGWIQAGALYFVDEANTILSQAPLSAELYDLIDVYAMDAPEESPFNQGKMRVYGPGRFFSSLGSLPSTIRDQVIKPEQYLALESTARRVGLTGVKGSRAELHIETSIQDHIDVTSITIPSLIHRELVGALEKEAQ